MPKKALRNLGRLVASALLAMAVVTPLSLVAQHWMTYELLGVDGGWGSWLFVIPVLGAMTLLAAFSIGVPCNWIVNSLHLTGTRRALAFCALSSGITAVAFEFAVSLATTAADRILSALVGVVYFVVLYAAHFRTAWRSEDRPRR